MGGRKAELGASTLSLAPTLFLACSSLAVLVRCPSLALLVRSLLVPTSAHSSVAPPSSINPPFLRALAHSSQISSFLTSLSFLLPSFIATASHLPSPR